MEPALAVIECTHPSFDLPREPPSPSAGVVDSLSVRGAILSAGPAWRIPTRHEAVCWYHLCTTPIAVYVLFADNLDRIGYCCQEHTNAARNLRAKDRKAAREAAHSLRASRRVEQERNIAAKAARNADLRAGGARVDRHIARLLASSNTQRPSVIRDVVLEEDAARRDSGGVPAGYVDFLLEELERVTREIEQARAEERACLDPAWRALTCPWPEKEAWLTADGAAAVIRAMREQGRPRAENLHPYHCSESTRGRPGCGSWHVGDRMTYEAYARAV